MDNKDIYERLTPIFHDVFGDDSLTLRPDMTADDVPEWDSLTHIRLMLTVQKEFNVKFSAAEIGRLKNVAGLAELISAKAR
jgi:acyl carrier protein